MSDGVWATATTQVDPDQQEGENKPKQLTFRFPSVQPQTAGFTVQLPPFPTAPEGFSGSLDMLLAQVRKDALSLNVLPLAPLVDQYLGYCERLVAEEDPHERMSDFLPLAATLIDLKSRLLLPQESALSRDQFSVRDEIVEEIGREGRRRQERAVAGEPVAEAGPERLTLLDLMVLLNEVQNSYRAPLTVPEEEWSVREAMHWIRDSLPEDAALTADTYFAQCHTRRDQAAVFLAILELGRNRILDCHQSDVFTPLWLTRTSEPEAEAAADGHRS